MKWLTSLFSQKIEREGYLTKQGHEIYYRAYGNPQGTPIISFHGGPGGASREKYARLFDLKKYYFIQFDQRGCGASVSADFLHENTTQKTLQDAFDILQQLNIQKPVISHGVSWGATLALLFAETYPEIVQKIIVSSVFLARTYDADWITRDSIRFYPDLWTEMKKQINTDNVQKQYYDMLFSDNPTAQNKALSYLGSYEYMLGSLHPHFTERADFNEQNLQEARIYFYYAQNHYFLQDDQILQNADKIRNIPTLITHNRMDFCCPVQQAWDLHTALPQSVIHIVPDYGHTSPLLTKETKRQIKAFLRTPTH